MVIGTNAGTLQVDEQGTLNNYGAVPYSGEAMTNILSLGEMTDRYRVTFDSAVILGVLWLKSHQHQCLHLAVAGVCFCWTHPGRALVEITPAPLPPPCCGWSVLLLVSPWACSG